MHDQRLNAEGRPVFWSDMMARWHTLPPEVRRRAAQRAGMHLHTLWRNRVDLAHLPLALSCFICSDKDVRWEVPEDRLRHLRFRQSHDAVRRTLIRWHRAEGHALSRREAALFLNGFLKREGLERTAKRQFARELAMEGEQDGAARPAREYAHALRTEAESGHGPYRGWWAPDAGLPAAILASEVDRAERTHAGRPLKQGPRITVFRATLFGKDTLVKRYETGSLAERARYLLRTSRGRRAWAVGETFRVLSIPTPRAYGYLEVRMRRLPLRSYVFTAFETESDTARRWVCRHWRRADDSVKQAFRAALQNALLKLYRAHIYHADTKLANLMAHPMDGCAAPNLQWIDLECVRFGVRPSRHRVIRNLVQLNGSARNAWVTEEERVTFLKEMARWFPFLANPRVTEKIRRWTIARWKKELRTRCGP